MDSKLPLLLYDSECTLCHRFKQALEKLDANQDLHYHSIRERAIFEAYPELDEAQCHDTVHLIGEDRQILRGPEVVEYLVKRMPGVSKFAWLLESHAGKKAVEFFYNAVNEYRKSSLNNCPGCKNPG